MDATEDQLRHLMCEVGRNVWLRGLCAGNEGNLSVRLDDHRVLCTPTGLSKGFMQPADLCVADLDARSTEAHATTRTPTSELRIHLAIYRRLPWARAVVHAHPPHAVAFCVAHQPLPEGVHPEAEIFLGRTVFAPYATPGGDELPNSFLPLMHDDTNTILLANHGTVSVGRDLTEAYHRLEILDNYARQIILARQLGGERRLSDAQIAELHALRARFGLTSG